MTGEGDKIEMGQMQPTGMVCFEPSEDATLGEIVAFLHMMKFCWTPPSDWAPPAEIARHIRPWPTKEELEERAKRFEERYGDRTKPPVTEGEGRASGQGGDAPGKDAGQQG